MTENSNWENLTNKAFTEKSDFYGGSSQKTDLKGGLGQFADLRRGLSRKRGVVFLKGVDTLIYTMYT